MSGLTVNYCPACGVKTRRRGYGGINLCANDSFKCGCGVLFILGPTPCYRTHVAKGLIATLRLWWTYRRVL